MMDRTKDLNQLLEKLKPQIDPLASFEPASPSKLRSILSTKSKQLRQDQLRDFANGAKGLIITISKMKQFLLENRRDYINLYSPLMSLSSKMTDAERDQIDYDVQMFMKSCNELMRRYRSDIVKKGQHLKPQAREHQNMVITLIEGYMKQVCDIYTQQKAIRVKRACEKLKMSRLAEAFNAQKGRSVKVGQKTKVNRVENSNGIRKFAPELDTTPVRAPRDTAAAIAVQSDEAISSLEQNAKITPEEVQLFEKENAQLYDDLNALTDEVRQIGGKVVEIARLQELFTEKVLEQEQELSRLSDTVISSTENIRGGNDQLREAIRQGAGLRVWVLFFIIMLAFTVLFLDWYNP
ncbi:Syntaxin-18 [Halotydeus destructor]|nr:Syntaxin-18 [Halotydeus destructor]